MLIEGHNVGSAVAGADVTISDNSVLASDIVNVDVVNAVTAVMVDIHRLGNVISHETVTITEL